MYAPAISQRSTTVATTMPIGPMRTKNRASKAALRTAVTTAIISSTCCFLDMTSRRVPTTLKTWAGTDSISTAPQQEALAPVDGQQPRPQSDEAAEHARHGQHRRHRAESPAVTAEQRRPVLGAHGRQPGPPAHPADEERHADELGRGVHQPVRHLVARDVARAGRRQEEPVDGRAELRHAGRRGLGDEPVRHQRAGRLADGLPRAQPPGGHLQDSPAQRLPDRQHRRDRHERRSPTTPAGARRAAASASTAPRSARRARHGRCTRRRARWPTRRGSESARRRRRAR